MKERPRAEVLDVRDAHLDMDGKFALVTLASKQGNIPIKLSAQALNLCTLRFNETLRRLQSLIVGSAGHLRVEGIRASEVLAKAPVGAPVVLLAITSESGMQETFSLNLELASDLLEQLQAAEQEAHANAKITKQ